LSVESLTAPPPVDETVMKVLLALSFSHLLNDTLQSLLPAILPGVEELVSAELFADRDDHVLCSK